jgi:ketosteroid isomerase-like protein
MKARWHLAILMGVAMLTPPALAQDLRSTIEAGNTAFNQAFNKGDAAAVTKLYTSDAKLLPPADKIVSGDKEIQAFWRSLIDAGVTDHKIETIQIEEAGDTAVVAGKWQATGKDAQGKAAIYKGSVMKVLERQGDTWKTSLHTWNIAQ